jgi:hypothetical protein
MTKATVRLRVFIQRTEVSTALVEVPVHEGDTDEDIKTRAWEMERSQRIPWQRTTTTSTENADTIIEYGALDALRRCIERNSSLCLDNEEEREKLIRELVNEV